MTDDASILRYRRFICYLAQSLKASLPPYIDVQDLINEGYIGLIDAFNRFDEKRNIPFHAYARIRIKGAMLDFLRKDDFLPRSVRDRLKIIVRQKSLLEQSLNRQVDSADLARSMGISLPDFHQFVSDNHIAKPISIDKHIASNSQDPLNQLIIKAFEQMMYNAIDRLPPRLRLMIRLYYFEDMNLEQAGKILGVTQSRACQLRKDAFALLRKALASIISDY